MERPAVRQVPAPALVLVAIGSVQFGSALARTVFDELGANGITLLRLSLAGVLLMLLVRTRVRRWSRQQWLAAALLGAGVGGMNRFRPPVSPPYGIPRKTLMPSTSSPRTFPVVVSATGSARDQRPVPRPMRSDGSAKGVAAANMESCLRNVLRSGLPVMSVALG